MSDSHHGRQLPVVATDAARVVGSLGVLACVLCCVSVPGIVGALSALGLGFLRNDRLLFPAVLVSLIILLVALLLSRARNGRNGPFIMGFAAAIWIIVGMRSPSPFGTIAALTGAALMVAAVAWDWRLRRHCAR